MLIAEYAEVAINCLVNLLLGWIDVTWDAGGSNSYRMGAEGKYDLMLAPSHDPEKLRRDSASSSTEAATSTTRVKVTASADTKAKVSMRC